MKKTLIMITAALLCLAAAAGCSDDTVKTGVRKDNSIAQTSEAESRPEEETAPPAEESSEAETTKADEDENEEQSDPPEDQLSYSNESGDMTETAVELHQKSCEMKWSYIFGCPYELDTEDMTENGAYRVIGADSVDQIKEEYSAVFIDTSEIDEKYFEQDGKVYCFEGGRGANIYYTGTELMEVSSDENEAVFTAVSHYADPDTREPMDSRSYDFKMVNVDGTWKTAEFTLPY